MKNIKVVYTDLDRTLLGPDGSLFLGPDNDHTLEAANALVKLKRANVEVVPVSGRNSAQLREVCRLLGLSTFIAELGCLISYDRGREIVSTHRYKIPAGMTLREAIAASGAPKLLLDLYAGRLEYHTPWANNQECTHLMRGLISTDEANLALSRAGFDDLRIVDNGRCSSSGTLAALPETRAYHLFPRESGKAAAIRADQKRRGFSASDCIALGDSISDLEMADAVSVFFLVNTDFSHDTDFSKALFDYDNVRVTGQDMGLGWAEAVSTLTNQSANHYHSH